MDGYREHEQQLVEALERWKAVEDQQLRDDSPVFRKYLLLAARSHETWIDETVASPSELEAWIRCRLDFIQTVASVLPASRQRAALRYKPKFGLPRWDLQRQRPVRWNAPGSHWHR